MNPEPPSETAALQTVLDEMRKLREEQERREKELEARIRRQEEELQRLRRESSRATREPFQLSPSSNIASRGMGFDFTSARTFNFANPAGIRFVRTGEGDTRNELGFKLKPDTYDGTVPLREFFS